jgi:mono/diheme cytochrome c family protein
MHRRPFSSWAAISLTVGLIGCGQYEPRPGTVLDEAARAGVTPAMLPAATEDYFHDMDFNLVGASKAHPVFTQEEIEGRNMWMVWTGGDDRLWDVLTSASFGTFDLLKTISSHPQVPYDDPHAKGNGPKKYLYGYGRKNRFAYLGLVNEPCFTEATGPDPRHFGLWIDQRDPSCPPDPFADPVRYPGIKIGSRGTTVPVGSYYGEPTGIVGLRLFPNPAFDEKARLHWDADKFYRDPSYYLNKDLVRPYRVGMSCAFCHVGPNPIKPPIRPEEPKWENLSSNVGAQFFWWDRVFNWRTEANENSLFFQALHVSRPGTLDTSLVSTDNINNPRTMNAVYYLLPRMLEAKRWGRETLAGGNLDNKQFNNFLPPADPLSQFFAAPSTTWTPRVLKDGSDSVGALGALNRVYINIGLFSEEWLLHFRTLLGGKPISPIPIATAEKNSVYWRATEMQTPNMARFFLASTDPHYLQDTAENDKYPVADAATLRQGKKVFADRCARCHSSDLPPLPIGLDLANANGPHYLTRWNEYWAWTQTDGFKQAMEAKVLADGFFTNNYLSAELRVPITLLGINACSPLATNALRDNIWDNFSSESYKELPSAGTIKIRHPLTGDEMDYPLPAGGRGYIRPASLVSLWSTAPFLQNNTVGPFDGDPSVDARMRRFDKAIEQMLWPDKRDWDHQVFKGPGPGAGIIDRTTVDSYLDIPEGYISDFLKPLVSLSHVLLPFIGGSRGSISIGPIPQGTPIGLVTNLDMTGADLSEAERPAHRKQLFKLLDDLKRVLKANAGTTVPLDKTLVDDMLAVSKCKDLVVNKGHYFGTDYFAEEPGLSDADKRALIELLKTF